MKTRITAETKALFDSDDLFSRLVGAGHRARMTPGQILIALELHASQKNRVLHYRNHLDWTPRDPKHDELGQLPLSPKESTALRALARSEKEST